MSHDKTADYLSAIETHSAGFAEATRGNLGANVEHCPDWDVADLVWHLTQVHWFWATIAEGRLTEPPDESRRPERPSDEALVDTFEAGARRLIEVLRASDQNFPVWTWASQKDIGFITRHQVQEAAVHHWDAVNAGRGTTHHIDPAIAADSVEEFLTFSVSSEADPAEPPRPALSGSFVLQAQDIEAAWTIRDGGIPGTIRFEPERHDSSDAVTATASDLLLWLYGRVELNTAPVPNDVIERFRALCFTD